MARIETNKAPRKIIVDGVGPRDTILVTDSTDTGTLLAALTVVDRNTLPEYLHNTLTVSDARFEIRDGGLYLKEGVALPVGPLVIALTATDAHDPSLSTTKYIRLNVAHVLPPASVEGDTLTLGHDGAATITLNGDGGWHVVVAGLGMDLTAGQVAAITTVQLHGNNALDIAGDAIAGKNLAVLGGASEVSTSGGPGALPVVGTGDSLNISGVSHTESAGGVSVGCDTDLSQLVTGLDFLVNGSRTDAFIAVWDYLDDAYAYLASLGGTLLWGDYANTAVLAGGKVILGETTAGAAALAVNMAVAQLDIDYANYLADGGSAADLTEFIAKTNAGGTRGQTMHDNLLGAISQFGITDRHFPADVEAALLAQIPEGFGTRPYASGTLGAYGRPDAGTLAAKAWDYAHGVDRTDYVDSFTGAVDISGTKGDGTMLFGNGNPATGYTIEIHDGSGVEFGFNVHYRTGDQIAGQLDGDGYVHFDAPAGHQVGGTHNVSAENAGRSAVSVDYALITGLNGTDLEVTDYVVKLLIDLDPSAAVDYKTFTLTNFGLGSNFFVADDGSGTLGDTIAPSTVAEDSFNFGFGVLTQSTTGNSGDLAAGTYDIVAEVWDDGVQLIGNHIVLDVA